MWRLGHPLWQAAHRPLFFCAGLWALLAPAVWLWPGGLGTDPVLWHLHELLFGMGGAAVGGYMLTALPSWTDAGPVPPPRVRALTLLWVVARLAFLRADTLPLWLLLPASLGYTGLLALILAQELVAARVWSRLWPVGAVAALGLGDAVTLAGRAAPLALVLLFAFLISAIGGRAVPAFTRSWLQLSAPSRQLRDCNALSILALAGTALGGGMALSGQDIPAGICLLLAGILQGVRLTGWQPLHTRRYPALFMLHMAWVWVPSGLILLGVAMLRPDLLAQGAALHGLTMGAMGTMIAAIAGRAAMVRQDNKLIAGRGLATGFGLVWLAAVLRVASPFVPQGAIDPVIGASVLWMLGWATFLWSWRPALQGAVPWPILSARRALDQAGGGKAVPSSSGQIGRRTRT